MDLIYSQIIRKEKKEKKSKQKGHKREYVGLPVKNAFK